MISAARDKLSAIGRKGEAQDTFVIALVRLGELREMTRTVRDGRPMVVLVDPHGERFCQVQDPQLGEAEDDLVTAMLRVLGGS